MSQVGWMPLAPATPANPTIAVDNGDGTGTITNPDGSTVPVCTDCTDNTNTLSQDADGNIIVTPSDGSAPYTLPIVHTVDTSHVQTGQVLDVVSGTITTSFEDADGNALPDQVLDVSGLISPAPTPDTDNKMTLVVSADGTQTWQEVDIGGNPVGAPQVIPADTNVSATDIVITPLAGTGQVRTQTSVTEDGVVVSSAQKVTCDGGAVPCVNLGAFVLGSQVKDTQAAGLDFAFRTLGVVQYTNNYNCAARVQIVVPIILQFSTALGPAIPALRHFDYQSRFRLTGSIPPCAGGTFIQGQQAGAFTTVNPDSNNNPGGWAENNRVHMVYDAIVPAGATLTLTISGNLIRVYNHENDVPRINYLMDTDRVYARPTLLSAGA